MPDLSPRQILLVLDFHKAPLGEGCSNFQVILYSVIRAT